MLLNALLQSALPKNNGFPTFHFLKNLRQMWPKHNMFDVQSITSDMLYVSLLGLLTVYAVLHQCIIWSNPSNIMTAVATSKILTNVKLPWHNLWSSDSF